jgi:hypothetical protein
MPTTSRPSTQADSYRIGQIVQVKRAIDVDVYDVSRFVGRIGEVLRFGGVGVFLDDPTFDEMICVGFCDGSEESFWPEELGAS